jgi:hypothetical protein
MYSIGVEWYFHMYRLGKCFPHGWQQLGSLVWERTVVGFMGPFSGHHYLLLINLPTGEIYHCGDGEI